MQQAYEDDYYQEEEEEEVVTPTTPPPPQPKRDSKPEVKLSQFSIGDLFEQILKRTGLDEQREQALKDSQRAIQQVEQLAREVEAHIVRLDERLRLNER